MRRLLQAGVLQALTGSGQGADVLNSWQGGLLLLGYGLVAALLGTLLAVRRDVT
jgi:ABC-2 type transport system permease protein